MPKKTLLMMAKHWRRGEVKTRLAATVGDAAAAELHHLFVRHLSSSLSACAERRQLLASPDDACATMAAEVDPAWEVRPQGGGDLGQRMWRGFCTAAAARPIADVLMIGADLPTLATAELEAAFTALETNDVVLGPACDGGYYLIGLRGTIMDEAQSSPDPLAASGGKMSNCVENLFRDVTWGSSVVLDQTLQRARQSELSVTLLPPREDVDTVAELDRLIAQLAASTAVEHLALGHQIDRILRRHRPGRA